MAKAATLTDAFNTIDAGIWTSVGTPSISTNRLRLDFPVGAYASSDLVSNTTYDLVGSSVLIEIADAGTISTNATARLIITGAGTNNYIVWQANQSAGLSVEVANNGSIAYTQATGAGTWSPTTHRWLRIREAGGILYFESSPTSQSWTTHYSVPTSALLWSLAAVTIRITAGNDGTGASVGYVIFDNLNLPVAPPAGKFMQFFSMFSGSNLITAGGGGGGGGTGTLMEDFADFSDVYTPTFHSPAQPGGDNMAAGGGYIINVSTPYGQGFEIRGHDMDTATWASNLVAMFLNQSAWPFSRETTTEHWTWQMYLPTQTLVADHQAGVLFELGHARSSTSSGHHIALSNDASHPSCMKIGRQSAYGEVYQIYNDIPIVWDRWFPVVVDCKYSSGTDGYYRVWIDGTQWVNYSGQTAFGDTVGNTAFMIYRQKGGGSLANTVRFADIRYTIT